MAIGPKIAWTNYRLLGNHDTKYWTVFFFLVQNDLLEVYKIVIGFSHLFVGIKGGLGIACVTLNVRAPHLP